MTTRLPLTRLLLVLSAIFVALLAVGSHTGPATAKPPADKSAGTREINPQLRNSKAPIKIDDANPLPPKAQGDQNRPPKVGDQRIMLALDDFHGQYIFKTFTFRGSNKAAEVWVANNLNFPTGDCRNGPRTTISNDQVSYLLGQFANNIRPTDTSWFGEPAVRTGKDALLDDLLTDLGLSTPAMAYFNGTGKDLILVDNVRDDNYFDTNNANSLSYIAGFFSSTISFYTDRNVMTVDAFDWLHRTGANPPHSPTADPCTSAPARPFLYEGVFAHEYQHLIHADYDPDEVNWVNEGMSDFAELLTGYADTTKHVNEKGYDSHINNFLGWASVLDADWNPIPRPSGPENSLTVWGDQGDGQILADYGHAFFFMEYLYKHGYGKSFFTAWHHNQGNGIDGLNASLAAAGSTDTFQSLYRDVAASVLADGYADQPGVSVTGDATQARLQNDATDATVYFSAHAYASPGAPPWGSDYIPLGSGDTLGAVAFDGGEQVTFPGGPQWTTAGGYFAVTAAANYLPNLDVSIVHAITAGSTLTFDHYIDSEDQWDYGFVQISDDGGATWQSLACTGTTTSHDPGAIETVVENMPGYTGAQGSAGSPLAASCSLAGYSGPVLLAFRFVSDPSVQQAGWFVKNIQVDGTPVEPNLANWDNQKFYDPAQLDFQLQFVGLNGTVSTFGDVTSATGVKVIRAAMGPGHTYNLPAGSFAGYAKVIAIVTGVPEEEDSGIYSPYVLTEGGVHCEDSDVCGP